MFEERAKYLIRQLKNSFPQLLTYKIAGGSLLPMNSRDIDLFDVVGEIPEEFLVSTGYNARTYVNQGTVVQICRYTKQTMQALIQSFDFAHCQIAAQVVDRKLVEVRTTPEFQQYLTEGASWFVGSEYPIGSLIRLRKFSERKILKDPMTDVLNILTKIIDLRLSYDAFKDHMEAIDILMLDGDHDISRIKASMELWKAFTQAGLTR